MAWSRRKIGAACALGLCLAAALSFGPLVRARIRSTADRLGVDVSVGRVWPSGFGVRLSDVVVRLSNVDGISARFDDVRVGLDVAFHPSNVAVHGGEIGVAGSFDRVRDELQRWRATSPESASSQTRRSITLASTGLQIRWLAPSDEIAEISTNDVAIARSDGVVRCTGGAASVLTAYGEARLAEFDFDVGADFVIGGAHVRTIEMRLSRRQSATSGAKVGGANGAPIDDVDAPENSTAELAAIESARSVAFAAAAAPTHPMRALGSVRVDAASIELDRSGVPITIGPGKLAVDRTVEGLRVEYATAKDNDGTPLSLTAMIPVGAGDLAVALEGGPVSLAALGLHDGAAGLFDTAHATVAGRTRIVAGAGSVTFDGEVHVRNASARVSRLASEPIRGIDAGIQARGALSSTGALRVDDMAVSLGAFTISGSGGFEPFADHAALHFQGEVARASCQALLDSMPTALIPSLHGVRYVGAFAARGTFAADTSDLDHLQLEYTVDDGCRVVDVPPELARDRFTRPFTHRIYHPDGSAGEATTGPGAPGWVSFGAISPFVIVAVMTTEDGGFYRHHGFSRGAIRSALIDNLKARRFVRGASTVSMQLAKNLFLTREKTVGRKLEEVVLTDYLEQTFTKDELMELYLNVIEFGPDLYGIGPAARDYFGRSAGELDLAESLFLSSVLPSPLKMHPLKFADHLSDGWQRTLAHLMSISHRSGLISQAELDQGKDEIVIFHNTGPRPPPRRFDDAIGTDATDDGATPPDVSN